LSAKGRRPNEGTYPNFPLELRRINVANVAKAKLVIGVNDVPLTLMVNIKRDDAGAWMMKPECLANRHGSATKVEDAIVHYMNTRKSYKEKNAKVLFTSFRSGLAMIGMYHHRS
jgi:hypothetical protein